MQLITTQFENYIANKIYTFNTEITIHSGIPKYKHRLFDLITFFEYKFITIEHTIDSYIKDVKETVLSNAQDTFYKRDDLVCYCRTYESEDEPTILIRNITDKFVMVIEIETPDKLKLLDINLSIERK